MHERSPGRAGSARPVCMLRRVAAGPWGPAATRWWCSRHVWDKRAARSAGTGMVWVSGTRERPVLPSG